MKEIQFTSIALGERPRDQHVWQVIVEQAQAGQATLYKDEHGAYFVQFPDEERPIPFDQLAYSKSLGLYDRRQFPG